MILETWEGVKPKVGGARERISDHRDFERWCLRIVVAAETKVSSSDCDREEVEAEIVDNGCLVNGNERTVRLVRDESTAIDKPICSSVQAFCRTSSVPKYSISGFGKSLVIQRK